MVQVYPSKQSPHGRDKKVSERMCVRENVNVRVLEYAYVWGKRKWVSECVRKRYQASVCVRNKRKWYEKGYSSAKFFVCNVWKSAIDFFLWQILMNETQLSRHRNTRHVDMKTLGECNLLRNLSSIKMLNEHRYIDAISNPLNFLASSCSSLAMFCQWVTSDLGTIKIIRFLTPILNIRLRV